MTVETFEALRYEYDTMPGCVGPLIFGEVERAARLAYGDSGSPEALEELVQETFTHALLKEGQLRYIMDIARNLDDFRRLLFKHVKRSAGRLRRREHTVIDNLLRRSRVLLSEPPFIAESTAGEVTYRLASRDVEIRVPTHEERWRAAVRASAVPKVIGRPDPSAKHDHASVVYNHEELVAVLTAITDELPTAVTENVLREIFEQLLTDWVPVFLEQLQEPSARDGQELAPDEVAVVHDITERVLSQIEAGHPDLATVLRLDLAGVRDEDIASIIGVRSRGTVINRHKLIEEIMRAEMANETIAIANGVLCELGLRLAGRQDHDHE